MVRRKRSNSLLEIDKKVSDIDFYILSFFEYENVLKFNYNVKQLKEICKNYKLKVSGNKKELINRIYLFLKNSFFATKIQATVRKFFCKLSISLRGPALFNKNISTNDSDFCTLDKIKDISFYEFVSWRENQGIFSSNIYSLKQLFKSSKDKPLNPYNRNPLSNELLNNVKRIIKLNLIFGIKEKKNSNNPRVIQITNELINNKIMDICLRIDQLGNYTDINWFKLLSRRQIMKFFNVLYDIWNYRAQIPENIKREICAPHGRPFLNINLNYNYLCTGNLLDIKYNLCKTIDNFINKGINEDTCSLGAMYVLSALTLVSESAAIALPWLYQSVAL